MLTRGGIKKLHIPTYTGIETKHQTKDAPKRGAPKNTKMDSGIREMEISITDSIKPSEKVEKIVWII